MTIEKRAGSQAYYLRQVLNECMARGKHLRKTDIAAELGLLPQQVGDWFIGTTPVPFKYLQDLVRLLCAHCQHDKSAVLEQLVNQMALDAKYHFLMRWGKFNGVDKEATGKNSTAVAQPS